MIRSLSRMFKSGMRGVNGDRDFGIFERERRANCGFMLVELMVVCSIILILSVYVSANYHRGNQELSLEMAAGQLAQNLRRTQEWGYSAHQISGVSYTGYGITMTSGGADYSIYTDDDSNGRYTSAADTIRETVILDSKFKVESIKPCGPLDSCAGISTLSVNFIPPDPGTLISNSSGTSYDMVTIVLGVDGISTTRSVVVNRAGLIYVQ